MGDTSTWDNFVLMMDSVAKNVSLSATQKYHSMFSELEL